MAAEAEAEETETEAEVVVAAAAAAAEAVTVAKDNTYLLIRWPGGKTKHRCRIVRRPGHHGLETHYMERTGGAVYYESGVSYVASSSDTVAYL